MNAFITIYVLFSYIFQGELYPSISYTIQVKQFTTNQKKKKKKLNIYQDFQKNGYQKYFEIKYLKVYLNNNKKIW